MNLVEKKIKLYYIMLKSRKNLSKKHYKKQRKSHKSHKYSTKKHRKSYKNKKMSRRIHRGGNPYLTSNSVKQQWNKSRVSSLQSAMQKHVPDDLLLKAKHSAKSAEMASKEVIDHITNAATHLGNHILSRGKNMITKIQNQ